MTGSIQTLDASVFKKILCSASLRPHVRDLSRIELRQRTFKNIRVLVFPLLMDYSFYAFTLTRLNNVPPYCLVICIIDWYDTRGPF
jgi:uncharacterized membrane protein